MAAERRQNGNIDRGGAARELREAVPPGISRRADIAALPVTPPSPPEAEPVRQQLIPWQRAQIARHPDRPHTLDYIQRMCTDFVEMHGDRRFGDDAAIIGGLAGFEGQTVMVIGQQKGRSTKENLARNFGMPQPEGYRKAERVMKHAARFGFPILTFIDSPGANPGMQAEERGIAQAIADNLLTMLELEVPVIISVIGEGGSGGALAIGVGDRVLMLENAIYTVASPEAAATILWRDAAQAPAAAEAMRITAPDLYRFGVVDEVIPEPEGGAHIDPSAAIDATRDAILRHLLDLQTLYPLHTRRGSRALIEDRRRKYRSIGQFAEIQAGE